MAILLPFLVLPFGLLIAWSLNTGGHLAHRFSEQVRIDALTLSICHHRKNFIEKSIVEPNRAIKQIQSAMNAAALSCLNAISCAKAKTLLESLSKMGVALEKRQDFKRIRYLEKQIDRRQYLERENELSDKFGSLQVNLIPIEDGFSREKLSGSILFLERIFGTPWPKRLEPNFNFILIHHFRSEFHPHRGLISQKLELKDYKNLHSKNSISTSECKIIQSPNENFEVIRK